MINEAFMAGIWSSLGSTIGKLSGTHSVVGDSYLLWIILLIVMVFVNTWGCRCYLRSLDASANSVAPTVISSASSYILSDILRMENIVRKPIYFWKIPGIFLGGTIMVLCVYGMGAFRFFTKGIIVTKLKFTTELLGLIGLILFNEASSIKWWIGFMLIVQGLALVARQKK